MSYCRFSSDDFQCDVYVYEDCAGGWTTHVASSRIIFNDPLPPRVSIDNPVAFLIRYTEVSDLVERATRIPIGLPYDGETFSDETPGECAETLEMLKDAGYNVPQYAIIALKEEDEEGD